MAHAKILSDEILGIVSEQIGELLPAVIDRYRIESGTFELGDSFELWVLDPDYGIKSSQSLNQLTVATSRWHHQIIYCQNDLRKPIAFAISAPGNPGQNGRIVNEVSESEIAEKIDAAMKWIDGNPNLQGDPLTHLLILQNYSVFAFWLVDTRQVYVIGCPRDFTQLRPDELLREQNFLTGLRREKPIIGRYKGESGAY